MSGPEAEGLVAELARAGRLDPARAARLGRIARGELVTVRAELRALLYAGVTLVMAGVALLVRDNLARIGPVTIAAGLGAGALACLLWALVRAAPFSWGEVASPDLAFDYVLLLGALLLGADLAYIEVQFTPLGDAWPWHLLLLSAVYALLALRFDSRPVFSLALTSFAAWRGVSMADLAHGLERGHQPAELRASAVLCGALFVALGRFLEARRRKAHWEPVAAHLGWLLALSGLASGIGGSEGIGAVWSLALLATGATLAVLAARKRRFPRFAIGLVGAYVGLCGLIAPRLGEDVLVALWYFVSGTAVLVGLAAAGRILREQA